MALTLKERYAINALQKLNPSNGYSVGETYESLQWFCDKKDKPTEKEFNDAVEAEKKIWEDTQYQRDREPEYPSIADQLDEIYHNGVDSWKAVIKKTKDKYPKG